MVDRQLEMGERRAMDAWLEIDEWLAGGVRLEVGEPLAIMGACEWG